MQNIKTKHLAAVLLLFISSFTAMANNQLTIEPIFDNVLQIPANTTRLMQYKVTNHDKIDHHFILKPISSVTQITSDPDDCQLNQTLHAKKSCILKLQVSGTTKDYIYLDGPALCESGNLNCIKPKKMDRLAVEKVPEGAPMISVTLNKLMSKPSLGNTTFTAHPCRGKRTKKRGDLKASSSACSMQLFYNDVDNGIISSVTVFNQSTTPISTSIEGEIALYSVFSGYDDDCYYFSQLDGNTSCRYYFQDQRQGYLPPTGQLVVGSLAYTTQNNQTGSIPVSLQEFNIGDQYPCPCESTTSCTCSDNYLFTLPADRGYYWEFYTAAGSDLSASNWYDQWSACNNTPAPQSAYPVDGTYYPTFLPGPDLLNTLWSQSNCNNGNLITGFSCTNNYWANDWINDDPFTYQFAAIDFSNGSSLYSYYNNNYPARCVNEWYFYYKS